MSTASRALPDCLYSVAQVRELDRIAIQELGIPGYRLMRRAAGFGYQTLQKHWPEAWPAGRSMIKNGSAW